MDAAAQQVTQTYRAYRRSKTAALMQLQVVSWRCHSSGYNGPPVFTHRGPRMFTQTGPPVFTQAGPVMFTLNGPGWRW